MAEQASDGRAAVVSITRVNDTNAYGALDVIGAATGSTAIQTFRLGGSGAYLIRSTTLAIDAAALIASETSYTLQLYSEAAPSAFGDNTTWDIPAGDRGPYLGSLALGTPVDVGASLFIAVDGINKAIYLPTENLYAYLVTTAGYTPTASRVYRIRIVAEAI